MRNIKENLTIIFIGPNGFNKTCKFNYQCSFSLTCLNMRCVCPLNQTEIKPGSFCYVNNMTQSLGNESQLGVFISKNKWTFFESKDWTENNDQTILMPKNNSDLIELISYLVKFDLKGTFWVYLQKKKEKKTFVFIFQNLAWGC